MSNPPPVGVRFVVGLLGVFILIIVSLAYAAWESGRHYEPEQIQQAINRQIVEAPQR